MKEDISAYEEGNPFTQEKFLEYLQQEYPEKEASKGFIRSFVNRKDNEITEMIARPQQSQRFDLELTNVTAYRITYGL
ncbi:MAG: hypothetical protein EZS28_045539 [Streblomastix strix]|uniref:Uncharacterized protein n=1 Tax=Streblomastix strix TaxID=222440 RepID=A0A5J4TKP0_9EUKA|nr:MAG: hypothetical protein EZS28_045539 [Streblomastix strix]